MVSYTGTENDYPQICEEILKSSKHKIYFLIGEMGAGKTSLTKAFLDYLKSETKVSSPTFSIVNEYLTSQGIVYHFDLYRLNNVDELLDIAIDEYLYSGSICFIEWPQLLEGLEIDEYHTIEIEILDKSTRKINFS